MALHTHSCISICSGIGGLDIGVDLALGGALRPLAYVEREAYAAALLAKRMEEGALAPAPIWDDVTTLTSREFRAFVGRCLRERDLDFLIGGIPCQPWSVPGKRLGADDERDLWDAIHRAISAFRPRYVFVENVPRFATARGGLDRMVRDLSRLDYRVSAGLFSAEEVGASMFGLRLFVLAATGSIGRAEIGFKKARHQPIRRLPELSQPMDARVRVGFEGRLTSKPTRDSPARCDDLFPPAPGDIDGWRDVYEFDRQAFPVLLRLADGTAEKMANRHDAIRACGNGVVPQQAAYAFVQLAAAIGGA